MKNFQVAFTRDFLDESGELAYGDIGLQILDESPLVSYRFHDSYAQTVIPAQIADTDGLVIIYPHITQETFAQGAERLVFIGRCGVGYDRIDLEACTENDVALLNAPDAIRTPTAAGSLMFMLALSKRLTAMDKIVRKGRWDEVGKLRGVELNDRTLGIVGLGNSGRELARLVAPFAMRLLAYSPHAAPEQAKALNVELVSLQTLLREADFICLHCRLTPETEGLIGDKELALMKHSAYLINMARGPIINHKALVRALQEKQIAGAALDVFYTEPLPAEDPITELDNVILAPHQTAGTLDVYYNAGATNCRAMIQAARGELPPHIVNRDVIDRRGFQAKLARFQENI